MMGSQIKRQLFFFFSLALNLLFMVNYSTAEVVKYRINAVVESSNWPDNGSCAFRVSQPGTTAQLYLALNEPVIPSDDLICDDYGCDKIFTNVVVGWSITFSASDECTIVDTDLETELDIVHVYDDHLIVGCGDNCDGITVGGVFGTVCPQGYDDSGPVPIGGPFCMFTGMVGDPSDSSLLHGEILFLDLHDQYSSFYDNLIPPISLATLADDPAFAMAKFRIAAYDIVTQSGFIITYNVLDVIILNQPSTLIVDLIDATSEINASNGVLNSLDAKLESAVEALDDVDENNDLSAVNKLQAFINAVEAQRGNHISEDDADSLIAAAQEIIDMLSLQ